MIMKAGIRIFIALMLLTMVGVANAQTGNTRVVDGSTYQVHKVVSGETLYKISKKYNCTVKELQDLNKLGETLKIGQELLIPGTKKELAQNVETASAKHKVAKGETLSKIAKQYGTTVAEIKQLNNLSSESLKIGQVLKVPSSGEEKIAKVEEVKPVTVDTEVPENKAEEPKTNEVKKAESGQIGEVKRPAGPRQAENKDSGKKSTAQDNGGMPRTAEVLAETATEKEENAMARVIDDKMDQTRTFVVHPSLPKGSIIVVINEATGKMAYCRVVDNVKLSDLNGANLGMTKAVAEKIGFKENQGSVKIKYAAP
jgi:LysM repeat protein